MLSVSIFTSDSQLIKQSSLIVVLNLVLTSLNLENDFSVITLVTGNVIAILSRIYKF